MARLPNNIHLWGKLDNLDDDKPLGVAATPGMCLEMYNNAGVLSYRPVTSATEQYPVVIALNRPEENRGVDSVYPIGDRVPAWYARPGDKFWPCVPSGQDITQGDYLQQNGDGWLKKATDTTAGANLARFQAMETIGAVTVLTRVKVQVV